MPQEQNVVMTHDKIEGKGIASKTAFEKVWKAKGWKLAPKAGQETAGVDTTPDKK